jgi:tyrosyl-tRNA synthetase
MNFPPINEQMDAIRRGASEIIPEEELARKLERAATTGTPLNVKLGCDPSAPDLHLGHSVVLRKLRQFQDLGHQAILIVGDFTGMIGDPTGKNKTRPPLTLDETRRNGQSYFEQAAHVLDTAKVQIRYNSDWLSVMHFEDVIKLAAKYTVARMLERDEFEKRFRSEEPISVHEFLYPLAQAMDSVAIRSDVELGGTDQKFNLLVGRDIQREYGQEPQAILTMPLLVGTDGTEKMSKSLGNYIAFNDTPKDMYGRTLSIPDALIIPWFTLLTDETAGRLRALDEGMKAGANPRDAKRELARAIVARFYSAEAAQAEEEAFDRTFREKLAPEDMAQYILSSGLPDSILEVILAAGLVKSKSEGRQMLQQSAVSIDGEKVKDPAARIPDGPSCVLRVGKLRFVKVIRPS